MGASGTYPAAPSHEGYTPTISERGMSDSAKNIHLVEIYRPVSWGLCEPDLGMWVGIPGQPRSYK